MSRHFTALKMQGRDLSTANRKPYPPLGVTAGIGQYDDLINRIGASSVLSLVGSESPEGVSGVCRGIAAEAGVGGRRIVIVPTNELSIVKASPTRDGSAPQPFAVPNTWIWRPEEEPPTTLFREAPCPVPYNWLDLLRKDFDFVILVCHPVNGIQAAAAFAAMADATVLVVESGVSIKAQIREMLEALQAKGALVLGSVLIRQR